MTRTKTCRLLLIEDHLWFRQALAMFFEHEPDIEVVGQAGTLADCRDDVLDAVDVAVVDLGLPDGDGIDLIRWLRLFAPHVSVLVLTISMDPEKHEAALGAGAEEVVSKAASIERILAAVRRLKGSSSIPHSA
jgi:DNA-binding NarL/FixJ family response regulator